jgi:hypothetical protein
VSVVRIQQKYSRIGVDDGTYQHNKALVFVPLVQGFKLRIVLLRKSTSVSVGLVGKVREQDTINRDTHWLAVFTTNATGDDRY